MDLPWLALAAVGGCLVTSLLVLQHFVRRSRRSISALHSAELQLERLQQAFHRFAPREVVESILERGDARRGERKTVTVLFADIVGFTALSETMEAEALVQILNGYFQRMSSVVTAHRGHVAKFIGDGLLATFGALDNDPWQCAGAVDASLEMEEELNAYNRDLRERGQPQLRISIGIHCGPVVAGVIGSEELIEFTVIGDTVNTASRIEGLTRLHKASILVSGSVREKLGSHYVLREMPAVEVKGKREPILTYSIERRL